MRTFKFTIKGHEYDVEIRNFENNLAEIEVNGTMYQVEVQHTAHASKTPVIVRSEQPAPRSSHKFKKKIGTQTHFEVKAPLPGNITQVFIKEGDIVTKGQKLLVYEAMKMENTLTCDKEGTVQKLHVAVGDSVLQGDLLMEIA
jgi:biotin carboxyl carrier protein